MSSVPGMIFENLKREKERKNWEEEPSRQEARCSSKEKREIGNSSRRGGVWLGADVGRNES